MSSGPVLIEGYAALFGVADLSGDVVRAGAFAASLRRGGVPMLLQHRSGAVSGRWTRMPRPDRGRDLISVELVEISLVAAPMQPLARFRQIGKAARAA